MSNLCILTVTGNLTRDPDQKTTTNGRSLVEFTVANSQWDRRKREEYTTFYRVSVWLEHLQAQVLSRAQKGTGVTVVGDYNPVPKGDGSGAVWHNIDHASVEFGARQRGAPGTTPSDTSQHTTTIDNDDDIPF